jgi:hypothetical protein
MIMLRRNLVADGQVVLIANVGLTKPVSSNGVSASLLP